MLQGNFDVKKLHGAYRFMMNGLKEEFRHADELQKEFKMEGDVIPMSFIINNGDQDPAILINGFGEGYGDTGNHFAVTDDGEVIYTTVQEGYKEGIEWLHKLVTEDLIDPEAFTQEWSTYVAKGKNHRYGLCFTWDIANIDNNTDYVMLPHLRDRPVSETLQDRTIVRQVVLTEADAY